MINIALPFVEMNANLKQTRVEPTESKLEGIIMFHEMYGHVKHVHVHLVHAQKVMSLKKVTAHHVYIVPSLE